MNDMLSVSQAAEFMQVSEMSIRRWTNEGKLKCCRVGNKRERRFKVEDLQAFLHKDDDIRFIIDGIYQVPPDAHVSHFYRTEEECIGVGVTYVKEALGRGELALVMSPEERRDIIREKLEREGVLVPILEDQGILKIFEGKSTPQKQIDFVYECIDRSSSLSGFSLLGDMLWTRRHRWDIRKLAELENLTNRQREKSRSIFFCQYDVEKFSRDEIFMAMKTHTHTIYHRKLNKSPYYGTAASWEPAS